MKRTLLSYNLAITILLGLTGLFNASNPAEVVFSLLFFPLAFYFAYLLAESFRRSPFKTPSTLKLPTIIPIKTTSKTLKASSKPIVEDIYPSEVVSGKQVQDINRRLFLKLISSAGLSLFIMSLFTKKAQAAFFGSVPGPGTVALKDTSGTPIDPAKHHPTDGYEISDVDDASVPAYYGFVHKTGAWYILKEASDGTYRYVKGSSGYSAGWDDRDDPGTNYEYFDTVFG